MSAPADKAQHARIRWYRPPIEKNVLSALMRRSDLRGFSLVALHLLLVTATGSLFYVACRMQNWPLAGISLYAHGISYSFLGWAGAGHELAHRKVFRTAFLNDFFLKLFAFATWNNYAYFCSSHARHHQVTVRTGLDGEVKLPQTYSYWSWLWGFTFDLPLLFRALRITVENSLDIIRGDWGNTLFPKSGSAARRSVVAWARFVLVGHAALAAAFVATGQWPLLFAVTFAPFFATWLNKLLSQAQHFGMQPDVADFRLNSRTILLNPFLAFLYWQMNYHVEHHMFPNVPNYRLKRLRALIEPNLPPATDGIRAVLLEMAEVKAHQRLEPRYCLRPALPDAANAGAE